MQKFLRRETDVIFIMLGSSCNLHCRYCLQQCQELPKLPDKINPDIYDFIQERCDENGKQPVYLQFYGGEPLIYFDKIKEIVEHTKDMNVQYSTISNGRALTKEMTGFFNEHGFNVTISWDGPHVMKTRKYDVLKENHDNIMALKRLSLSAVLSSESYPREVSEAFNEKLEEHDKLHEGEDDCWSNLNFDYIFDTGIADKALIENIDYDRMTRESYEMTKEHIKLMQDASEEADSYKYAWTSQLFGSVRSYYENADIKSNYITYATCGNGYDIYNMDLDGNLYACHNIFDSIGDIYMPYLGYLTNVIRGDNSIKLGTKCNGCPAISICYGGCKLLEWGTPERESFCKIKKAVMRGVLKAYIEFGKNAK